MQPKFKNKLKDVKYSLKVAGGLYVFTFAFMIIGDKLISGRARSLVFTNLVLILALACCAFTLWLAFLLVKYLTERI
jgi:hypothetical protein